MTANEAYQKATELLEADLRGLSTWELDFLEDIQINFENSLDGPSEKQAKILDNLYQKYMF